MVGQHLIIPRMPTKIHQPCKGTLNDDPTAFDDGKSTALFGDDFAVNLVRLFLVGYPLSNRLGRRSRWVSFSNTDGQTPCRLQRRK